jgi:hypothetical protein
MEPAKDPAPMLRRLRPLARLALVALVAFALPGSAAGQGTEGDEGPRTQQIRAVERGGFLAADFGLAYLVGGMAGRDYGVAPLVGVTAGYDVSPVFNLSVGVLGAAFGLSADPSTPPPRGDLFFLAPILRAQLALVTTERNFLWVRAEGGFSFGLPKEIDGQAYGGDGPVFGGGVGFEHFTKLRHFSLGVTLGALAFTKPEPAVAITLLPSLKYTF